MNKTWKICRFKPLYYNFASVSYKLSTIKAKNKSVNINRLSSMQKHVAAKLFFLILRKLSLSKI